MSFDLDVITGRTGLERRGQLVESGLGLGWKIGFARRAADRVVVLAGGRIVEDGAPAQVIDAPQTERTRRFLQNVLG